MTPNNADSTADDIQSIINGLGGGGNGQQSTTAKPGEDNTAAQSNASAAASGSQGASDDHNNGGGNNQPGQLTDDDLGKILNDRFGVSLADLPARLQERDQLNARLQASPYKSDLGKAFDEAIGVNNMTPEAALKYITTDFSKLDARELMAMSVMQQESSVTMEEALRFVDRKYGLGEFKKDDQSEKDGLLQLKIESAPVRENMDKIRSSMLERGKSRDAVTAEQANANRLSSWQSKTAELKSAFKEVKIPVGTGKDGKPLFEFPFKATDVEKVFSEIQPFIEQSSGLLADEKGVALVQRILQDRFILNNLPQITSAILSHGKSQNNQWWENLLGQPDFKPDGNGYSGGGLNKTRDEQIAAGIINAMG